MEKLNQSFNSVETLPVSLKNASIKKAFMAGHDEEF